MKTIVKKNLIHFYFSLYRQSLQSVLFILAYVFYLLTIILIISTETNIKDALISTNNSFFTTLLLFSFYITFIKRIGDKTIQLDVAGQISLFIQSILLSLNLIILIFIPLIIQISFISFSLFTYFASILFIIIFIFAIIVRLLMKANVKSIKTLTISTSTLIASFMALNHLYLEDNLFLKWFSYYYLVEKLLSINHLYSILVLSGSFALLLTSFFYSKKTWSNFPLVKWSR